MGESYAVTLPLYSAPVEDRAPRVGRALDDVGVVHQQVGAPAVRDAVHLAVDGVPRPVLEERRDGGVVGHQVGVHRGDVAGVDQPQRRVTGRRHPVVLAGAHQLDHLVGGVADLDVDLAAGLLLERRHPVDGRVVGAVLRVARPRDEVELALAVAHRRCAVSSSAACRRRRRRASAGLGGTRTRAQHQRAGRRRHDRSVCFGNVLELTAAPRVWC